VAATNLVATLFAATLFAAARRRLAGLRSTCGGRTCMRSRTTGWLTTTTAEQTGPGVGDAGQGHQSGRGQRRQQDTTVHGRYSFVRKNRMGYAHKMV
jgi:hypothetical protein